MDYITCCTELDMGVLGMQAADIEYAITNGKPEVIGVWLYNFCGDNHAADVTGMLTDAAHDLVHTLCLADMNKEKAA